MSALTKMTKQQLLDIAKQKELPVNSGMKKEEIIKLIESSEKTAKKGEPFKGEY